MKKSMSASKFKKQVKPLLIDGELRLVVHTTEEGFKIEVLEHEEGRLLNLHNEVVKDKYTSTTCISTLYTNEDGEVNFIEHPFGAFTKRNKSRVPVLLNLVGITINIDELQKEQKE